MRPRLVLPGAVLFVFLGMAVAGPLIAPHSPTAPDLFHTYAPPTLGHPLGTDGSGRDVLSRTIAATRLSLLLPVCVVLISSVLGSVIGVLSAAAGGWMDALSHRAMTVLMALPGMLLGIVVVARFGSGTVAPVCAVALGTIPHIALLVRSTSHELLSRQFMTAYRLAGFSRRWIMLRRGARHLLPVIGTQSLMNVGSSLLWLAGLSFLGLGVQPPDADWGVLIHDGRQAALRGQWWQALAPAVCLAAFVLATHALAEPAARSAKIPAKRGAADRTRRHDGAFSTRRRVLRKEEQGAAELLTLRDYRLEVDGRPLISGSDLDVRSGEIVCLVGPSGSGKSLLLASLTGRLPESANASGAALAGFGRLPAHDRPGDRRLRELRRRHVGVIWQESRAGLNPMRRIGAHMTEVVCDDGLPRGAARARAEKLLADVGLPPSTMRAYPGRLSGGMAARVAIAGALMARPRLLLADEPTAALDVVTGAAVADMLRAACREYGTGLLMTTHDEGLAHAIADRVVRLGDLALTEDTAPTAARTIPAPSAVTTTGDAPGRAGTPQPVVTVRAAGKVYGGAMALDDVSFALDRNIGLLGRSGSGKSTVAKLVVGLEAPTSGAIEWTRAGAWTTTRPPRLKRAKAAQLVWQDPDLALDPLCPVGPDLEALVRLHAARDSAAASPRSITRDLLHAVGLPPETYEALPAELSGGMRQRVVLARALAARPRVLVLDEPTAQLDRETAARLIDVIRALQIEYGITLLVISHDVSVLAGLAERIVVLDRGKVVEFGDTGTVLGAPKHPRTLELVEAGNRLSLGRTVGSPHRRGQDVEEQESTVR
nr:ATP-binding cassette domain-containing protein [Spelaeicoccus albus]